MTQAGYNMEALESCRTKLEGTAGPVGAIGDGFDKQHVNAEIFGTLDAAGQIASAVTQLDQVAKEQFDSAEELLRGAGSALDSVRTSVQDVDKSNAGTMRH